MDEMFVAPPSNIKAAAQKLQQKDDLMSPRAKGEMRELYGRECALNAVMMVAISLARHKRFSLWEYTF